MKKNFKVITINGIRGIIVAIFVVLGLIAGFIISPGWVCMEFWNYAFKDSYTVAQMNLIQGIMLWAIIALTLYALNNKRSLIGFGAYQGLPPEQMEEIIEKAKAKRMRDTKELEALIQKAKENAILKEEERNQVIENQTEEKDKKEEIKN